jgi:hypothetical protein
MGEWITVDSEKPKHGEKILAWCSNKSDWFSGYFSKYDDLEVWAIYEGSATESNVTHFMRVSTPEPPK